MILNSKVTSKLFLKSNPSAQKIKCRHFNYDWWFKSQQERDEKRFQQKKDFIKDMSVYEMARFVTIQTIHETKLYYKEMKETKNLGQPRNGEYEPLFTFKTKEDLDKWQISTDAGYKIGKSKAELMLTPHGTALFTGYVSNEYDKPEKMRATYTGYVNMMSRTHKRSFMRTQNLSLGQFNCFYLKIRGDGRNYMLVLRTPEHYTVTHNYHHMYPLHTRGGPYWQYAKIPFSKFFHTNYGRIADRQYCLAPNSVRNLGVTCMDGVEGPFQLEIAFIAALLDTSETEEFAYEMYRIPKFIANT